MATKRRSNTALAELLEQARWTNSQFARAVNQLGTEQRIPLQYDDSAVSHWLSGTMPRKQVRPLIVEAFCRRLCRVVTLADAGLDHLSDVAPSGAEATVAGLVELGAADMHPSRRAVLTAAGLFSVALSIPQYQDVFGRFDTLRRNPRMRIGQGDVDTVMAMTERLSDLDDRFGGRHARPLAAAFLVNTIVPYLHAEASESVRRKMLSAAADHCYLTGYMAMDERADGLAQAYYTKALELAGAAGDHLTYCTTLRGMSVQAVDLGHGPLSVRLAEAASAAAPQAGPRMLAFLTGQHAHAAASTGDRSTALAKLHEAETAMEHAESMSKAFGSYDPSSLSYHVAQVRYELGDKVAAVRALDTGERLRDPVYRRAHVRHLGLLAERKLELGRLEEACADWNLVLDDYPHVQSGRCDDRVRAMVVAVKPHLRNQHARQVYDRARALSR